MGRGFSWADFIAFIKYADKSTALYREIYGEQGQWENGSVNAFLLANIYDAINAQNYMFARVHSKESVSRPEPIHRPGEERTKKEKLDISEFRKTLHNRYGE